MYTSVIKNLNARGKRVTEKEKMLCTIRGDVYGKQKCEYTKTHTST